MDDEKLMMAEAEAEPEEPEAKRRREEARYQEAVRAARVRRWTEKGKSTVEHPKYGKVVVPHSSSLSAFDNAMEFWKVPESEKMDFIRTARCRVWEPEDGPVRRPREFYRKDPSQSA